jgi:hypothetical protein
MQLRYYIIIMVSTRSKRKREEAEKVVEVEKKEAEKVVEVEENEEKRPDVVKYYEINPVMYGDEDHKYLHLSNGDKLIDGTLIEIVWPDATKSTHTVHSQDGKNHSAFISVTLHGIPLLINLLNIDRTSDGGSRLKVRLI